jgi:uncharacterized protein (DUF1697 family)
MAKSRYVALLRGINVGGNNLIKMAALRESFEAMGFTDVATYIQSGNVVLSASTSDRMKLTKKIEATLTKTFGYESKIVLVSDKELERVVAEAPPKFGEEPTEYRYDVLFVKPPMTTREALAQLTTKPGVDQATAGKHALYFRRLIAKATQSHLPKIVLRPVYKSVTIRNWSTTTKLLALVSTTTHSA